MGLLGLLGGADFNPRTELFSQNEQGLWSSPSNMAGGKTSWRRNLLTYSQDISNSAWAKTNATVSANTLDTTDPFGGNLADLLLETTDTGTHQIRQNCTVKNGETLCISFYAKAAGRDYVRLWEDVLTGRQGYFDLSSGTATNSNLTTVSIVDAGNGWYRCIGTITGFGGSSAGFRVLTSTNGVATSFAGDDTKGVYIYGLQIESGVSTPTEYQPITDFSTEFKSAYPAHALYQDSNGVAPCTAPGDPVGLVIDQRQGGLAALGPELVPSTYTGSVSGTWAIGSSSVTRNSSTTGQASFTLSETLSTSKRYRLQFTVSNLSGDTFGFRLGGAGSATQITSNGVYTFLMLATGNNANIVLIPWSGTAGEATITNISVREVAGNHLYQTTSGARPTLVRRPRGGVRNLLTYSEQFDNAAWTKSRATVTANAAAGPLGDSTADKILDSTDTGTHRIYSGAVTNTATQKFTFSCYLKAAELSYASLRVTDNTEADVSAITFNLSDGSQFSTSTAGTTITNPTSVITSLGNGWYRYALTVDVDSSETIIRGWIQLADNTPSSSYTGTGTDGILAWGAQLETGSTATAYQKVVASSDVTESGQPDCWRLLFDGSDDFLQTNAIDFSTWTQETRRNLLLSTHDFTTFSLNGISATYNQSDPFGGTNATKLEATATTPNNYHAFTATATEITCSIYVKKGSGLTAGEHFIVRNATSATNLLQITLNYDTGGFTYNIGSTGVVVEDAGNGWWRVIMTVSSGFSAGNTLWLYAGYTGAAGQTIGEFFYAYGPQAEAGLVATDYQRVGTDEMTVIAGVRKLSDAATGIVAELSASVSSNNGSWYATAPQTNAGANLGFASKGTTQVTAYAAGGHAAPISVVQTGLAKISSDSVSVRVNGVVTFSSPSDQGSGNYGNYALYIGRRAGTSIPFNGELGELIVRGKTTSGSKLTGAEKFAANKLGITI